MKSMMKKFAVIVAMLGMASVTNVTFGQSKVDAIAAEYDRMEANCRNKIAQNERNITETRNNIAVLEADPMHSETLLVLEKKWLGVLIDERNSLAAQLSTIQQNKSRAIENERNLENALRQAIQKAQAQKQKEDQQKKAQQQAQEQQKKLQAEQEAAAREAKRAQQRAEERARQEERRAKQEAQYQANAEQAMREFDSKGSLERNMNYVDNCVASMEGISNDVRELGFGGSVQAQGGYKQTSVASAPTGNVARTRSLKSLMPPKHAEKPANTFTLDYNAIPWGTMKADAKPYSEWSKQSEFVYDLNPQEITPTPPQLPRRTPVWEGDWDEINLKIPNDVLAQVKMSIYIANDGVIPPMYYSKKAGKYLAELDDGMTIIALSEDGRTLDFFKMSEKEDINLLENVLDAEASVHVGDVKIDKKGMTYQGKHVDIGTEFKKGGKLAASKSDSKDLYEVKNEEEDKDTKKKKEFLSMPDYGLEEKYTLFESSKKVERKVFRIGDKMTEGYQWSVKGGMELSTKVEVSKESVSGSATMTTAEGSFGRYKVIPVYNGFVYSEVKITGSLGYKIKYKRKWSKKEVESSTTKSLGKWPISVGYDVTVLKYYSYETINNAMPKYTPGVFDRAK